MSKEATGENGAILGSSAYWSSINSATFLGKLMQRPSETNYHAILSEVGSWASAAVDEIYNDLQEHINSIRSIPSVHRDALAKQVQLMYDVCRMSGSFCLHSSDCIGILSLSSFYLPSTFLQPTIRSTSIIARSNPIKAALPEGIPQRKTDILQDVSDVYHGNNINSDISNEPVDLRGRCGYSIGSSEYLSYMERKLFPQDIPVMYSGNYAGILKESLEDIGRQIQLTDDTYNLLKDLKAAGKKVKIAGRVLLVAGIALDALELGMAVNADLKDADRKLGKTTVSAAVSIGGRWVGAAVGAKAGAALGAMTGPAAPIAIPVLSIAGGIGGSFAGNYLAKWVVDITYVED